MKRIISLLILVGFVLSLEMRVAAQEPAPGQFERYRTGDYTTPDGRQAIVVALDVLTRRGWQIVSVSSVVLPKGFVLIDRGVAYTLAADTLLHDIVVRWPLPTLPIVISSSTATPPPAPASCTDYNLSTPALDPPAPGLVCRNGGWGPA